MLLQSLLCCPSNSQPATNLVRLPFCDTLSISTCIALTVLPVCAGESERVRCPMASTVQCSSASLRLCVPRLQRRKSRYRSFSSYTLLSEHTCNQVSFSRITLDHATGQDTLVASYSYRSFGMLILHKRGTSTLYMGMLSVCCPLRSCEMLIADLC